MYECIYFISLSCIGISYLTSIMQTLSCVRKAKNVRAIRYCTGSIVVDTIRFLIFFTLYFNESFGTLYEYLYNNYDIYLLANLVFIVIVVSLYFVPTFIYDLINGYVHKQSRKRVFVNMRNTAIMMAGVCVLILFYLYMIHIGKLIWGMIPFLFALLVITSDAISGTIQDKKLLTTKALIWLSIQGIIVIGFGLIYFKQTQNSLYGYGLGVEYYSEAVNLFGLLIISLPLIDLLTFLEKKLRPHLIIEIRHEVDIED